jgi:predicted metal-dependent hydrolase
MTDTAELQALCRSILQAFSSSFRDLEVTADFFPYIGLTHTIRRRGCRWMIRISDHCRQAPKEVLEAIILLLACKVLRRKPPYRTLQIYERFRQHPEVERQVQERRLQRGRKQIEDAQGKHHSLAAMYRELNRIFFNDQVDIRRLGWGARKSWSRLGHYDPTHHTITISPVLDSPKVPKSVVSYLLYHEMLHTLFDGSTGRRRKRHHTPEFNRAERAFPQYVAVRKFLDRFCRTHGKAAWGSFI